MRAVVIGGFGNFGARVCRGLARDSAIEVIAAGRTPASMPTDGRIASVGLDISSAEFPAELRRIRPGVIIHCAGPFQEQDYRVAAASLAAGAHYVDLADGRAFVTRFAEHNDRAARAARRLAVSGASTVPALSSAVIDHLAPRLHELEEIRIVIAPGQRAPRGNATIAGVLSYAGKPFTWLRNGAWCTVWGWQELQRVRFPFGTRWAAACDIPDLELFPARYSGVRTIEFRAALELGIQHFALWVIAALRRGGLRLSIERWADRLNGLASWMDAFGSERSGMLVSLRGKKADGTEILIEWQLTADANHGPEIPAMAATLLTRKLARGEITARGAFACMGFLNLLDFEPEFARWKITTTTNES
jgi:saccharopine dehydrogenase-like NADP-dependent oxidoreductase